MLRISSCCVHMSSNYDFRYILLYCFQEDCTRYSILKCLSYAIPISIGYNEFHKIGSQLGLCHVLIYSSLITSVD